VSCLVSRDVDGEPVNLEDSICEQILSAAEALPYVELGDSALPAGTSSYDIDMDRSTPASSDPDVVQVSHLTVCQQMMCVCVVCSYISDDEYCYQKN